MKFQVSNTYWQERKKVGKPKKLGSPTMLWELACDYFQYCDENPWRKKDWVGKDAIEVEREVAKPYTWSGFEDFLNEKKIIVKLDDYKTNKDGRYSDYADIITCIGRIIYTQKFEGALVGAFNANLVARDLGLADKMNGTVKNLNYNVAVDKEEIISISKTLESEY